MNFALILFILVIVTGVAWVANRFYFAPRRIAAGDHRVPLWVEYSASFFPVICAVFFLRSFLFEPFKIPSGSMIPTLQIGDFILVNKFTYGIRLPVINRKVVELGTPKRGDVLQQGSDHGLLLGASSRDLLGGGDRRRPNPFLYDAPGACCLFWKSAFGAR